MSNYKQLDSKGSVFTNGKIISLIIIIMLILVGSLIFFLNKNEPVGKNASIEIEEIIEDFEVVYPSFYAPNITMEECLTKWSYFESFCSAWAMEDPLKCNNIEEGHIRKSCMKNVILAKAFRLQDASVCEAIEEIELRDLCVESFSRCTEVSCCDGLLDEETKKFCVVAISEDVEYCDKFDRISHKFQCIAKLKGDLDYCSKATKQICSDIVLMQDSIQKNDISKCEKLVEDRMKVSCNDLIYENQAIESMDKSICDNVVDQDRKKKCRISIE